MLLVTLAIVILSLVVKLVDGNQRPIVPMYVNERSISDDEGLFTSASGISGLTDDSNSMCCVYGNCSCNSLDHALANLTSNVLINITTDMTLSLLINASNLENVSIIGHNNPTVYCTYTGRIHFNFCHNFIIQDVTWEGCGTETEAAIKLSDSSNILFENCSFQYSKGPAIVLSGVSGHVNISHCDFVHNDHYGGHGAAIHYSSSKVTNYHRLFLTISNCHFSNNKNAKSLVYVKNMMSKYANNIVTFKTTKFIHNEGVSIYVVNQNIYLLEKVLFQKNIAKNGTGIYMKDHSTVIFGKNSDVMFIQNFAVYSGGAIFLRDHSSIIFDQNSVVIFNDNDATYGTIYSQANCNVTFQATCEVTFNSNSVKQHGFGSAIYSSDNCRITYTGNSKVTFANNNAQRGGTIYSWWSSISFEENSITEFTNNTARYGGGAIYSKHGSISFEENSITEFTNNTSGYRGFGGAIYSFRSSISFEENSNTEFTNNTSRYEGGAIYCWESSISFEENSNTEFTNNTSEYSGGVIYSRWSSISFEENSNTEFTNNTSGYEGGAIYSFRSFISFEENSITEFTNNTSGYRGGVIYSWWGSISFEENSTTDFINSSAEFGGAVFSEFGFISFKENSTTEFTNNAAKYNGGAICYRYHYGNPVSFEENSTAEFTNNIATNGGAIYTSDIINITFEGFSNTVFSNNIAKNHGGALCTEKSAIIFHNNSTVTFTHNSAPISEAVYCGDNSSVTTEGNSSILFNNVLAKWCTDMLCTPYTGQGTVTIDNNGAVRCSDQRAFTCLSENYNCKSLGDLLRGLTYGIRNKSINITDKAVLYSSFSLSSLTNVSIIGQKQFTVFCVNRGGLYIRDSHELTIQGITWVGCGKFAVKELL